MRTVRSGVLRFAAIGMIALWPCSSVLAEGACLLTPAELQAATGRAFAAGQSAKNLGDGSPLCHYAEKDKPQRKLTVGVSSTNAQRQFESRMRLLQMGSASIKLDGVGDRAYFSGTAAGVLAGDKLISISNLRRSPDPKIAPDKAAELLRAALKAAKQE